MDSLNGGVRLSGRAVRCRDAEGGRDVLISTNGTLTVGGRRQGVDLKVTTTKGRHKEITVSRGQETTGNEDGVSAYVDSRDEEGHKGKEKEEDGGRLKEDGTVKADTTVLGLKAKEDATVAKGHKGEVGKRSKSMNGRSRKTVKGLLTDSLTTWDGVVSINGFDIITGLKKNF